jgi:hypothetical protein
LFEAFCSESGAAEILANGQIDALLDTIRVLAEFDSPNDALTALEAVGLRISF